MSPIVRIADPRGSTPSPLTLVMVVVGSAALGLLLLKLSLVAPRPEAAALESESVSTGETEGDQNDVPAADTLAEAPPPPEDEAPAEGAGAAVTDAGAAEPVAAEEAPATEPTPELEPAEATPVPAGEAGGAERTVVHGRVAYFQCPNDECPRDHGLERSVWRALDRLGACLGAPGEADVRVSVQAGAVTDVRFRERGATGIDLGVLDRCVSPPLTRVTGSTLPDGTVVSFRFELR